jgi:hypothetical protein
VGEREPVIDQAAVEGLEPLIQAAEPGVITITKSHATR